MATALVLFALLFLCALLNSLFFPTSKLLPWLRSLLVSSISPPIPKPPKADPKKDSSRQRKQPRDEFADLRTVFATFDEDGDGYISAAELSNSLRRLGLHATAGEVRAMMERVDANGDGLIDLSEFRELYDSLGAAEGERRAEEEGCDQLMREAFEVFDGNGDGLIAVEELSMVLKSLGLKQGEGAEACRDMIRRVDLDGDGMVNFEEFKQMMVVKEGNIF